MSSTPSGSAPIIQKKFVKGAMMTEKVTDRRLSDLDPLRTALRQTTQSNDQDLSESAANERNRVPKPILTSYDNQQRKKYRNCCPGDIEIDTSGQSHRGYPDVHCHISIRYARHGGLI
jgi:hypothetical protein